MALHPIYLADFCTGTGMLGAAVDIAIGGIRTVLNVERESYAAAALVARMEEATLDKAPLWDDVKSAICPEIVEYLQGFRPLVLTAGYPCQPFSCAGKRLGEQDERHLWPAIDAFIGAVRPELVFLENVPGHLRLGFAEVRRNLENRGYRVAPGLFSAEEVGASHKRQRLFILAQLDNPQRDGQWPGLRQEGSREIGRGLLADSGPTMADAEQCNGGSGPERSRRPTRPDARRSGEGPAMADSERIKQGQQEGAIGEVRGRDRHGSEELADAGSNGRRQGPEALLQGPEQPIPAHVGEELADACGEGLQGPQRPRPLSQRGQEEPHRPAPECGVPVFAPGPGELEEWGRLLGIDPSLEPAIRRASDGYATGLDACRLRLTGNGVVPLAAAYAFVTLYSALNHSPNNGP